MLKHKNKNHQFYANIWNFKETNWQKGEFQKIKKENKRGEERKVFCVEDKAI